MTAIRYRVDNVPVWGMGAFMPAPAQTGTAATGGTQKRYLQQWTEAPPPALGALKGQQPGGSGAATTQGSYGQMAGLPQAFLPQVNAAHHMAYWTTPQNMGPGDDPSIKIYSDNVLPVPAANPGRVAVPAMTHPPFGTVISTAWPRPFITWPTWGQSRQA